VWIDTGNESSTYALSAQKTEILDKVKIARAFTPFQHHTLIQNLEETIEDKTEILVIPNIDMMYSNGQINEWEAEELFKESWNKIKEIKQNYNIKILVSTVNSVPGLKIKSEANHRIEIQETEQGDRYEGDKFQQNAYRRRNSLQTTLSAWQNMKTEKIAVKPEV